MSNRERALDAALLLFNEKGSGAVSTNHIAAEAGISPGNLYYHFKNKQHIISALFDRLFENWESTFRMPRQPSSLTDLKALISANFTLIWEYRFAYRELSVLLRRDSVLAARYRELRAAGYGNLAHLIETFAAAGVIRPLSGPAEMLHLCEVCWLVSEQWPIDLELRGRPFDSRGIKEGIALLESVFDPYIVENSAS